MRDSVIEAFLVFFGIILLFFGFGKVGMPGLIIMIFGLGLMLTALYLYNRKRR